MSALRSSEASAPQRFKCISIMGSSNGATKLSALGAVSSLGGSVFGGSTVKDKDIRMVSCSSVWLY